MKLYFDLDGVIRNLHDIVIEKPAKMTKEWFTFDKNGKPFNEIVDENLNLLVEAEPTMYYPVVGEFQPVSIITCQPDLWKPYTEKWVKKHFDKAKIIYVNKIEEKEAYLDDAIIVEDYPLYPARIYHKLIMIDYPYNRDSGCFIRVTNPTQLRRVLKKFTLRAR
jgi:hypothetical protein